MNPEPFKSVILIMPVLVPELGVMDNTTGTGYFVVNPFERVALRPSSFWTITFQVSTGAPLSGNVAFIEVVLTEFTVATMLG